MMESKILINRYCRTRAPPATTNKEKKRLPRSGGKIEGKRAKQDFLTNERNICTTTTRNPSDDAAHNIFSSLDSPILSPETSIALDNAERVVQNALLEIKQLNAEQCRARAKGGIRLQVHEPSFEDDDDQLLYVRERVAAKLYAIDSGIEPVQVVRHIKNNIPFMLDLTNNAEHVATRLKSLKKGDGKSLNCTAHEPKETREERAPVAAGDCIMVASSETKSSHINDLQTVKQSRFPTTSVQKKLEGFSIQSGTSVNIGRELTSQKLQDIHISPDSSFIQDAPNIGVYRFQYQLGSTNAAPKNRQKVVRIENESYHVDEENKECNEFQPCVCQDKPSAEFIPTAETMETVAQSEKASTNIPYFSDPIESRCIRKQTVDCPKEDGFRKADRHDANSIIPTDRNNDRSPSRNQNIAHNETVETVNYLRNVEEETGTYENERSTSIGIRFKNIFENYSERKDPSIYLPNPNSVGTNFLDSSNEDVVIALNKVDVYQPSIAELDTVINAHNKAIKRFARGVKRIEQFLSDNKIAQYRNAGYKLSKDYSITNLLVSNKGERIAPETRVPSFLPKQRKSMRSQNLVNQQSASSRNDVWTPGKAMTPRQPKMLEAHNEFLLTNNHYKITGTFGETNDPKGQLRKSDRGCIERNMNNEFNDSRECFTEDTNPPTADKSESIYTDDNVKIKNVEDKADLPATIQSHLENSQENDQCSASELNDHRTFAHSTGAPALKELLLKMKDSNKTVERFHTSFRNIETENIKKLFETELMKKEMNPEIIRFVIKNLETYVRDLQDITADPAATNLTLKNNFEGTPTQVNTDDLVSPVVEQECTSIEKQLNESQTNESLSSKKVTTSVTTLIEEHLSNKDGCENKKGISSGSNTSSLSCKKTVSLPIHESSRIDNKMESLINSNVKSLEEISFIKASEDCSNDRNSIEDTKISLLKKQSDSQEVKTLQIVEQNSTAIKRLSCQEKTCDSDMDEAPIRKGSSPRDCASEPISTSADSLQDCPSLSASSNTKQTSHKSSNKISALSTINSNSVHQDFKGGSHDKQSLSSLSQNVCESRQNSLGSKLELTNGEKCKQAQPLSEGSHSEGEICLSSSCSFSLGEVRRGKTESHTINSKRNDNESSDIFVTYSVQIWNESSDSQSESPGEI